MIIQKYGSCKLYIVLFVVFLVTSTVISTAFTYFYWYSKKNYKCLLLLQMRQLSDKLI